jgi:hypothetical protein
MVIPPGAIERLLSDPVAAQHLLELFDAGDLDSSRTLVERGDRAEEFVRNWIAQQSEEPAAELS